MEEEGRPVVKMIATLHLVKKIKMIFMWLGVMKMIGFLIDQHYDSEMTSLPGMSIEESNRKI